MNSFAALVAEHCPTGVEFKALGQVGKFTRGNGLQKKDLLDAGVGAIHYGQIFTHYGTSATETKSFVDETVAKKLRKAKRGDLVIATTSENDADVCKAVAWLGDDEIAVSGDAYVYSHELDPRYVSYFFQSTDFQRQKAPHVTGTKVRRVNGTNLATVKIPVPPAAIQARVVEILDSFERASQSLCIDLKREVVLRARQYEYTRNQLLTFGEDCEWSTLGEHALIGTGSRNTVDGRDEGAYPFYVRSQQPRRMDAYDFDETAILTSGDGAGVGKVFHFVEGRYALHQRAYRIVVDSERLDPKFFFHFMRHGFLRYLEMTVVHSSVTSIRKPMLVNYPVPLPPIDEQRRVVTVLDEMDALFGELSSVLPAEIEARRKQYEYYRDKLLAFPEKAAEEGAA